MLPGLFIAGSILGVHGSHSVLSIWRFTLGYGCTLHIMAMDRGGAEQGLPDLQVLWETSQREVALEGSNGCTLERLWQLLDLDDNSDRSGGATSVNATAAVGGDGDDPDDPRSHLKGWLWRWVGPDLQQCNVQAGSRCGSALAMTVRGQPRNICDIISKAKYW